MTAVAKCSWPTVIAPRAQRSPRSCEEWQDRLAQDGVEGVARRAAGRCASSARASSRPRSAVAQLGRERAEVPSARAGGRRRGERRGPVARGQAGGDRGGVAALDVAEHPAHALPRRPWCRGAGRSASAAAAARRSAAPRPAGRRASRRRGGSTAPMRRPAVGVDARPAMPDGPESSTVDRGYFLNNPLTSSGQAVQLGAYPMSPSRPARTSATTPRSAARTRSTHARSTSVAMAVLDDHARAQDVVQDVFLRAVAEARGLRRTARRARAVPARDGALAGARHAARAPGGNRSATACASPPSVSTPGPSRSIPRPSVDDLRVALRGSRTASARQSSSPTGAG